MSPVWIKLGDFGVSKRVLAQAATTLHTQVSTQAYSAPEVLGLDSNSETSDYTNSVDIWSLGCVIYELLIGTKLFPSEGQVSRYYFGKLAFPEDKLKGLSPLTADIGISLLKSMLLIQPEDRPTAAAALSHEWLSSVQSDNEDYGEDQDEVTQGRDETPRSTKRKYSLASHDPPKKRRSNKNQTKPANTSSIPGGVALGVGAGSQSGDDPSTQKTVIDTSVMTTSPTDAAFAERSAIETGVKTSELMPHNSQATDSKCPNPLRKTKIRHIPQKCPQSSTPNTKLNLPPKALLMRIRCRTLDPPQAALQRSTHTVEIVSNPPETPMDQWNTRERKCRNPPPSPPPPPATELYHGLHASEHTLPGRAVSNETVRRIQRTKPNTAATRVGRSQNDPTINPMRNPNTWRKIHPGQERNVKKIPSAGSNTNTRGSQNLGRNSNC